MTEKLSCLDIFCGMGGWSIGFYRQGFECFGVDIVDVGYPYSLRISDIRDYHPVNFDVVLASPPCTEFSVLTELSFKKGQRGPREPEKGIELVKEAQRVIKEARPSFWVIENVYGSLPYLKPILGNPMILAKPWVLWGNLPPSMFEFEPIRKGDLKISHTFEHNGKGGNVLGKGGGRIGLPEDFPFDPLRSWKRARIPIWLSESIAKQIRNQVLEAVS